MIQTAAGYNPFPIIREVDCKISFGVIDQSAVKGEAVITSSGGTFAGAVGQTVDDNADIGGKFASLEQNAWRLDGSFDIMPDDYGGEVGWWTDSVSGADGTFSENPYIAYMFDHPISTLGWTLHFDGKAGEWADQVRIEALDEGGTAVDTGTYTLDDPLGVIQHYVGDYYGVCVTFLHTSDPLRRVRLIEFDFGITKYYDRNSIGEISMKYGADLLSRSLTARELIFTFDNSDKQYNLLNPTGVYQYLQDGQKIRAKFTIGGNDVDMGEFYFTRADISQSYITPTITAHDRVFVLDNDEFNDGADVLTTLSAAIDAVIGSYRIPIQYDDGTASAPVRLSIPQRTTRREAVRMLAQAARASVWIARDGKMHFSRPSVSAAVSSLDGDSLRDWYGVAITDIVDGIRLTVKNDYRYDSEREEYGVTTTYTSGEGERITNFNNPCVAESAGQDVADWMLALVNLRKTYSVKNRCDPAVEIGDTISITDVFDNVGDAIVTSLDISYNGELTATTGGVGNN